MAGMGDNPLVGEYTKGISKGPGYFQQLERRILAEKFDARFVAQDMRLGLFRDMDPKIAPPKSSRFVLEKGVVPEAKTLVKRTVVINCFSDLKGLF